MAAEVPGGAPVPLHLLLAAASDMVTVNDRAGTVLWSSAASDRLLGLDPSQLAGTDAFRLVHPDDRPQLAQQLRELLRSSQDAGRVVARLRHADGGWRTVESVVRNHLHDPALRCVVVSTRDITDRAAAQSALHGSEARHRQLVESAPVGLCVVDEAGLVRFANPSAVTYSGRASLDDLHGRRVEALVQADEREACRAAFRRALVQRETPPPRDYHLLRPDGVPLVVRAGPLPYEWDGRPAALVVLQDVTALRAAEAATAKGSFLLARILEASAEGVVGLDHEGRVTFMNRAAGESLGLVPADAVGRSGHMLYHHSRPDGTPYLSSQCPCMLAAWRGQPADVDGEVFWRPDGTSLPVAYRVLPLRTDEHSGAVLTFQDVSERNAAREQMARAADFCGAVLDSLPALTAVVDRTGRIRTVNEAWHDEMLGGGGRPETCGVGVDVLAVFDRVSGPDRAAAAGAAAGLRAVLAGTLPEHRSDVLCGAGDAGTYYSLSIVPLHVEEGGAVLAYTDVTARKRLEVETAHRATHDVLTGLPNRVLLMDRLRQALAVRGGPHVGVLFLDLDGFKLVNDGYGHEAGDDLLVQLAARLRALVRPEDTVARLAGDEFVVLCTRLDGPAEAERLSRRLLHTMTEPFTVGPAQILLGVSIGVALADDALADAAALLQAADQAMFDAKARGRNRYRVYDRTVHGRDHVRLAQALVLRRLVDRRDLLVHYQPMVDLRDGRIEAAEALLRWRGENSLPDTATAVTLAEEIGLIGEIDRFVLHEALHQGASFRAPGGSFLPLSVNVAPQELEDALVVSVEEAAGASGYPLTSLTVELTERSVMTDPSRAVGVLRALRAMGVRVALDDFGVGHGSLASLRDLPLDVLKIDAGFVRGLLSPGADSRIVTAILQMGRALELDVVAEGVEHAGQRDRLLDLGCEHGQGFLFSPARPAGTLRSLVHDPLSR